MPWQVLKPTGALAATDLVSRRGCPATTAGTGRFINWRTLEPPHLPLSGEASAPSSSFMTLVMVLARRMSGGHGVIVQIAVAERKVIEERRAAFGAAPPFHGHAGRRNAGQHDGTRTHPVRIGRLVDFNGVSAGKPSLSNSGMYLPSRPG